MIDKTRIEALVERTKDAPTRTKLMMLWNGFVAGQKAYMEDSTAKNLRDMKASEAELDRVVAEIDRISGSEMPKKDRKRRQDRLAIGEMTDKQERFCLEYIKDLDPTQAAKRAGYHAKKDSIFRSIGCENLTKPTISRRILELKVSRAQELKIEAQDILKELWNLARGNQKEYVTWDNKGNVTLKASDDISEDQAKRISTIKQTRTKTGDSSIEIKFYDKIRPLELCGQHIGMFGEGSTATDPEELLRMMAEYRGIMDATIPKPEGTPAPEQKNAPGAASKAQGGEMGPGQDAIQAPAAPQETPDPVTKLVRH